MDQELVAEVNCKGLPSRPYLCSTGGSFLVPMSVPDNLEALEDLTR